MAVQFKTRTKTDYIVIHCSATKPSMDIGVRDIRLWHKQQGWLDVGYNFVIKRDGTLENGRPQDAVGSHAKGYNSNGVGVCLVGGVDNNMKPENNFTEAQWETLKTIVTKLRKDYPNARVCGHTDLDKGKACPSFNVAEWLAKTF